MRDHKTSLKMLGGKLNLVAYYNSKLMKVRTIWPFLSQEKNMIFVKNNK